MILTQGGLLEIKDLAIESKDGTIMLYQFLFAFTALFLFIAIAGPKGYAKWKKYR